MTKPSTRTRAAKGPTGPVALVGAGSGDPSLLVVRAADLLRRADVVLADERCAEALLAGVREDAEVVRTPAGEAQGAALVAASKDGRAVVRLRPGTDGDSAAAAGLSWEPTNLQQLVVALSLHTARTTAAGRTDDLEEVMR